MQYRKDATTGALELMNEEAVLLSIPAEQHLAICHDGPVLVKHGPSGLVLAYADQLRSALRMFRTGPGRDREAAIGAVQVIEIPVADLTLEALEEINACLAISGRIEGLAGRLGQLAAADLAAALPDQDPAP